MRRQNKIDEQFNSDNLKLENYNRQISKLKVKINIISNKKENLEVKLQFDINNIINDIKQNFVNLFVESIEINYDNELAINNLKY